MSNDKEHKKEPIRLSFPCGQVILDSSNIDREKNIISGVSIMRRGVSLGWDHWIDSTMLRQVSKKGKDAGDNGIKVHLTHSHVWGEDGVGSMLGRMKNFRVIDDGEAVTGDLHFIKAAFSAPGGDFGTFVMDLAEDAADMFGLSIVFWQDPSEQDKFVKKHGGDDFKSPDPENTKNFPHFRLEALSAVDVVGSPAANAGGLFLSEKNSQEEIADIVEQCINRREAVISQHEEDSEMKESIEVPLTQDDLEKAAKKGGDAQLARVLAIQEDARELGQVDLGAECIKDGLNQQQALKALNRSAKIANAQARKDLDEEIAKFDKGYASELDEMKALKAKVSANAEDNELGSKKPKTKAQELGTEVSEEDVDAYMAQHEGISFADAMNEVSKQAIGKGV